ncbi:MAG TPA: preprotein translocase subunit SecE [Patescibacteria group bacterium]|nr:preprotein translocase subunit SecE [Patescibacteria group bacterium]
MKAAIEFIREVRVELSKVVWPKKAEVIRLTMVVFVFSAIVAVYLGGLDFIFVKAIEYLLKA